MQCDLPLPFKPSWSQKVQVEYKADNVDEWTLILSERCVPSCVRGIFTMYTMYVNVYNHCETRFNGVKRFSGSHVIKSSGRTFQTTWILINYMYVSHTHAIK